jgi:nitrate reductase alpha subunit
MFFGAFGNLENDQAIFSHTSHESVLWRRVPVKRVSLEGGDIYKGLAKKFSELCVGHLGVERDIVSLSILHDTPGEMAQALGVKDWKRGEVDVIPGKTMPSFVEVERDYPQTYKKFTSLGPLMTKIGNGGKGITWNTEREVGFLEGLNRVVTEEGISKGLARIESAIDAAEVILSLAPETNGQVAVRAWESLGKFTGRDHTHLAKPKEDEKIRFRDVQAQPRKIISSPTVCSETCVGRIRYLGVLLYDADRIKEAASVEDVQDLYESQLDIFLDSHDPEVIAEAKKGGIPEN